MWRPISCLCLCRKYGVTLNHSCFKNLINELILGCPGDQTRFGDSCYDQLPDNSSDIITNADGCMEKGGLLWFPENSLEIQFILKALPSGEPYHLGYKNFSKNWGITFLDGSQSPGIPFFSRNQLQILFWIIKLSNKKSISEKTDFSDTFGPGPYEDLITESDCLMLHPNISPEQDSDRIFKPKPACDLGKGICKYKLGI